MKLALTTRPPAFGIDPISFLPTHSGGLLEPTDAFVLKLLRGPGAGEPEIFRDVALEIGEAMAASDVPADPFGSAARLLRLAAGAIDRGERAHYDGCRFSLEGDLLVAGLDGLDRDPAEATVLLTAAHLLHDDPFRSLLVALGMMDVRRRAFGTERRDAGARVAARLLQGIVGGLG